MTYRIKSSHIMNRTLGRLTLSISARMMNNAIYVGKPLRLFTGTKREVTASTSEKELPLFNHPLRGLLMRNMKAEKQIAELEASLRKEKRNNYLFCLVIFCLLAWNYKEDYKKKSLKDYM